MVGSKGDIRAFGVSGRVSPLVIRRSFDSLVALSALIFFACFLSFRQALTLFAGSVSDGPPARSASESGRVSRLADSAPFSSRVFDLDASSSFVAFSRLSFYAPILPRTFPRPVPSPSAQPINPSHHYEADESGYSASTIKAYPSSESELDSGSEHEEEEEIEDQSGIRDRSMRRRKVRVRAGPSRNSRRRQGDEMEVLEEQIWELMALQQREGEIGLLRSRGRREETRVEVCADPVVSRVATSRH